VKLGVMEGIHGTIQLANGLNRLDCRGKLLGQCINPFTEPVKLPAKKKIWNWHLRQWPEPKEPPPRTRRGAILEHMADLYEEACGNCRSSLECQELV